MRVTDQDRKNLRTTAFLLETIAHLRGHEYESEVVRQMIANAETLRELANRDDSQVG